MERKNLTSSRVFPAISIASIDSGRRGSELRFTVRRPPIGEVSPCCHHPSGGDVACSVDVGVAAAGIADFALEDRLALAVPGCDVPACGATLRRVHRGHSFETTKRFVLQTFNQHSPCTSADLAVESTLMGYSTARSFEGSARGSRHGSYVERLNPDHLETPREVSGGLLDPILSPVGFASSHLCNRAFGSRATFRATLAACEMLLQLLQPFRLTRGGLRRVQEFAGGQCGRDDDAAVNADHTAVFRAGDRVGDMGERDMPAARTITGDPVRLDTAWHWTRKTEPNPTNLRYPDSAKIPAQFLDMARPNCNLPKSFVHTGLTPRRTPVRTAEEILHRLCKIPQRLLLHRLTSSSKPFKLSSRLCQLRRLHVIAGRLSAPLPMLLLLDRQVPHIPCIPAVSQQNPLLFRGGHQPEPRHDCTIAVATDIPARAVPLPSDWASYPNRRPHFPIGRTIA